MKRIWLKKPRGWNAQKERFRAIVQTRLHSDHKSGKCKDDTYLLTMIGSEDDRVIGDVLHAVQQDQNKYFNNGSVFNWDNVLDWMEEHWLELSKLFLDSVTNFNRIDTDAGIDYN